MQLKCCDLAATETFRNTDFLFQRSVSFHFRSFKDGASTPVKVSFHRSLSNHGMRYSPPICGCTQHRTKILVYLRATCCGCRPIFKIRIQDPRSKIPPNLETDPGPAPCCRFGKNSNKFELFNYLIWRFEALDRFEEVYSIAFRGWEASIEAWKWPAMGEVAWYWWPSNLVHLMVVLIVQIVIKTCYISKIVSFWNSKLK